MHPINKSEIILQPGDIIVYNATEGGWFSTAQRTFTRMPFTHSAPVFNPQFGIPSVIEAINNVSVTPFQRTLDNNTTEFYVFRINNVDPEIIQEGLKNIYERYAGKDYGYLQTLYFVPRYLAETKWINTILFLPDDVRHWKNPFPQGIICSELVYELMKWISDKIRDLVWQSILSEWGKNNFHSGDVFTVCRRVPRIRLKYKRIFEDGKLKLLAA